jgi:LacI family transcriptional regulator
MIDVARAAGVSLGTVSNVVNNPGKVTPATRQKVEAAIAELGFVRNGVARSLRAGRSTTIGFVLVDLGNSFFLDLVRGAEAEVSRAGMNLLLANADMSYEKEQTYLALFEEERVAGILLTPRPVPGEVGELPPPSVGVPRVLLNDPEAGPDVCSVQTDNVHGGYLAARHLIESGRRRLVFAGGDALDPVRHRYRGVVRAVEEADGVSLERVDTYEVTVHDGREVADELLRRPAADRPDGILARLVRVLRPDASVVAGDPDDARIRTAVAELTATGRADTVVAATDARRAVKAVRRGGHVCVGRDGGALPSTTELVQREVTLVGPRTLAGLLSDTLRRGVDAALDAA